MQNVYVFEFTIAKQIRSVHTKVLLNFLLKDFCSLTLFLGSINQNRFIEDTSESEFHVLLENISKGSLRQLFVEFDPPNIVL